MFIKPEEKIKRYSKKVKTWNNITEELETCIKDIIETINDVLEERKDSKQTKENYILDDKQASYLIAAISDENSVAHTYNTDIRNNIQTLSYGIKIVRQKKDAMNIDENIIVELCIYEEEGFLERELSIRVINSFTDISLADNMYFTSKNEIEDYDLLIDLNDKSISSFTAKSIQVDNNLDCKELFQEQYETITEEIDDDLTEEKDEELIQIAINLLRSITKESIIEKDKKHIRLLPS